MSWLQQQPFLWPWQTQSCPVDNHPECCCKGHFSSSLLWPLHTYIALQHQFLLHLINYQLFAFAFKTLHSLFPPHSLSPVWYQEANSSLVSIVVRWITPYLYEFYLLTYYIRNLYFLPHCFSHLGRVLQNKHQWNEIMNLLKLISLKASLLQWWLVEMWY